MKAVALCRALVPALVLLLSACDSGKYKGGGDLRAQKVVLKREVDGLRQSVARLEKGESVLPIDDVVVAIDDALLRDVITAQLPFEMDVQGFHLSLTQAEAQFRGSPIVRLRGVLHPKEKPELAAAVAVMGALVDIRVDAASSTLQAKIAVDHLGIEKAAGIEQLLSGSTMDELGRLVRLQLGDLLPPIQIPVTVQQSIDLPAVTTGPVRIDGARMPLQASVSQVLAGQGRLWISVHFQPGDLVKTADAPEAGDASAHDAGVSLDDDDVGRRQARGQGKGEVTMRAASRPRSPSPPPRSSPPPGLRPGGSADARPDPRRDPGPGEGAPGARASGWAS